MSPSKTSQARLTPDELGRAFADPVWAAKFPPVLSVDQVAELLQLPKPTIYLMSSRGEFESCCTRVGKHLRFYRDRVLQSIFKDLDSGA